jgi:hypothetical protein
MLFVDKLTSFHLSNMNAYPDYRASNSTLTVNTVRGVLDKLHMRVRSQEIVELVMGRYGLIRK